MILGIDPGTTKTAFALLDGKAIRAHGKVDNHTMLGILQGQAPAFNILLQESKLGFVAIECMQSYGNAVGSEVFDTLIWIGRFCQCAGNGPLLWPVFRKQVVMAHAKSVTAGDSQVRAAMVKRFGPVGTRSRPGPTFGIVGDVWSALAIASFVQDRLALGLHAPRYNPFAPDIKLSAPYCRGSLWVE